MGNLMQRFLDAVVGERTYQADKFGGGTEAGLDKIDDERNDAHHFVSYIAGYASRWFPGGFGPWDEKTLRAFQTSMVKTAALCYAGYAWAERKIAALQPVVSAGEFKVGDVVVRASGIKATIVSMTRDGKTAEVKWFDDRNVLHAGVVATATLTLAEPPAAA